GRVVEWKCAVDDWPDDALFEQRPHFALEHSGNLALLRRTSRAQRRAGDRQAPTKNAPEIKRCRVAAHEADHHEASVDGKRREIARDVVAAHDVENEVDATASGGVLDRCDEVLGLVVDATLGPKLLTCPALVIRACGRKDA